MAGACKRYGAPRSAPVKPFSGLCAITGGQSTIQEYDPLYLDSCHVIWIGSIILMMMEVMEIKIEERLVNDI